VPPRIAPPDPAAPWGRKPDGTPRRSAGGRRARPRETDRPAAAATPAGKPDYAGKIAELADGLYMLGASLPLPPGDLRIRVRAQAAVLKAQRTSLASGLGVVAEHSPPVARGIELLTGGSAGWILPACMALAPFAVQTAGVWRAPTAGDMTEIAEGVEADWSKMLGDIKAALGISDDAVTIAEGARAEAEAARADAEAQAG